VDEQHSPIRPEPITETAPNPPVEKIHVQGFSKKLPEVSLTLEIVT